MKNQFSFFAHIIFAWLIAFIALNIFSNILGMGDPAWIFRFAFWAALILLLIAGARHWHQVNLIFDDVDASKLKNRHQRQIEIPFDTQTSLSLLEASIRELEGIADFKYSQEGARLTAKLNPINSENDDISIWKKFYLKMSIVKYNLVIATTASSNDTVSVTLQCEPDSAAWMDWLFLDEGSNLQNAETITRAISRRIAAIRRGEQETTHETVTEKELAVAKLSLLHAQVEPHFLYNTLGSAKYLISSDPVRAEAMLDSLILYLRHSLPRSEDEASSLGQEVERTKAYLDILKIRMGERLQVQINIPETYNSIPFPTMMLQTLVENSINHGLEPKSGGGTIWIGARSDNADLNKVIVTVADDGVGFGTATSGTGIGLNNVRERLKLAYAGAASFSIVTNFPEGVAASISVPTTGPQKSST
jgi:signal transduction histidine kinase